MHQRKLFFQYFKMGVCHHGSCVTSDGVPKTSSKESSWPVIVKSSTEIIRRGKEDICVFKLLSTNENKSKKIHGNDFKSVAISISFELKCKNLMKPIELWLCI